MSKFFQLTKDMPKPIKKAKKIKTNKIPFINLVICSLIIVASLAYIIEVNGLVASSYQIKDLQGRIDELAQDSRTLKLKSLELQSMDRIQDKISQLNMVEAGKVEYLRPEPLAAAR